MALTFLRLGQVGVWRGPEAGHRAFPIPLPLPLPQETAGGSRGGAQSGSQVKDVGKVESEVAGASRQDLSPGGLALGALGRGLPTAACGLRADPAGPRGGSLGRRSCAYCTEGLREDHAGAGNKVLRRCRGETSGPSPRSPSPGSWGLAGHVGDCGVTPRTSRRKTEPHVSWGREPRPPGPRGRMARRGTRHRVQGPFEGGKGAVSQSGALWAEGPHLLWGPRHPP